MDTITREIVPLYYETIFDEEAMSISFSLFSEANDFFLGIMNGKNPLSDYIRSQKILSPFVFPKGESWGFGNVFRMNNARSIEEGWTTWECLLPRKASVKKLQGIVSSINQLIDVMQVFSYEKKNKGSKNKQQLMTIDLLMVSSDTLYGSGGMGFSYALPVLEFCRRIWSDETLYAKIIEVMQKTWIHLSGEKKLKSWDKNSFLISACMRDERLVLLKCPGNCASVGTSSRLLGDDDKGMDFSSHNVETKYEQITLLAGAIKIANLARRG